MNVTRPLRTAAVGLALAAALSIGSAQPSDIDLYSGAGAGGDRANVLFLLDSSSNWSSSISGAANCYYKDNGVTTTAGPSTQGTKFAIEMCALYNVVDALPVSSSGGPDANALVNIGIMLMNEPNSDGGYPRQGFLPLTTNNKTVIKARIAALSQNGDKGSNADYGQALYEAYLYYKGMAPRTGTLGSKWDGAAVAGGRYVSPSANSCARNYVILIGNGSPQNSSPEGSVQSLLATRVDTDLAALPAAQRDTLKAQIINPALGNDAANWSDEMARFIRASDFSGMTDQQGIITHAVAVKKGPSDGNFPALMNSVANYGGGSYYEATSADVLVKALLDIFNQIQAANSVFASASLPVSLDARGSYDNQIFIGMFRPNERARPRWMGNLKQYRFGLDAVGNLLLTDANGNGAINSSTGFISPSAQSYWSSASDFWQNAPSGTPLSASDAPDGEIVEKGGAAQRLRTTYATSQASRKVYTCVGCAGGTTLSAGASTRFESSNAAITQAALGVTSGTDRSALIDWLRGANNAGDEPGPVTSPATTVRGSIHGDVLHSRPVVLNYGGSTGIVVFYGANDGQLRAVNGNRAGSGAGEEIWSFVPEEHFGKLKRLRSNDPAIQLSTTPLGLGTQPRDYFVDGPIGIYLKRGSASTVNRAILYVGMRRGGRQIYAIDVTVPTQPKFLWKVSNASAGMSLLGQTWSEPVVAQLKGMADPALIFGAGYDAAAEDSGASTTMGNAVYVLNALTGTLVRTFTTLDATVAPKSIGRSVAADVSLIDSDYDGKVDRAYAVDLGGRIYRIDFESPAGVLPSQWTVHEMADLSGGTTTGRKFFYGPDVIVTKYFVALLIGSGDREKPLLSATQDHFFQIFDRRLDKGAPPLASPITWSTLNPMGTVSRADGDGCYMPLAQGEKVVTAATSIAGRGYFSTHRPVSPTPTANVCSANLGTAKAYEMPLFCVSSSGALLESGGLPPSPVAGVVTVTKADGTTEEVPFVIGAPNARNSPIEGSRLTLVSDPPRKRRYWYQEIQR